MIGKHKCQLCSHVFNPDEIPLNLKCNAFPEGIPEKKIAYIQRDSCIDCNNRIGFEPKNYTFEEYDGYKMPEKQGFVNLKDKIENEKEHEERLKRIKEANNII